VRRILDIRRFYSVNGWDGWIIAGNYKFFPENFQIYFLTRLYVQAKNGVSGVSPKLVSWGGITDTPFRRPEKPCAVHKSSLTLSGLRAGDFTEAGSAEEESPVYGLPTAL